MAPPIAPRTTKIHPLGRVAARTSPITAAAAKNPIQTRRWASNETAPSGRTRAPPVKGLTRCGGKLSTPLLKSIESLLMFVPAWRHTTPKAVSTSATASNLPVRVQAIAVPSATPTREARKLCGWVALNQIRREAILFPDRLLPGEHADLDQGQGTGTRVDDGVRLALHESGDRARSDVVRRAVGDDLAAALEDVENLRVPMPVRRRLYARLHAGEAHEHEVTVPWAHDLLVDDPRSDSLLPRFVREVSHHRALAAHHRLHRRPRDRARR